MYQIEFGQAAERSNGRGRRRDVCEPKFWQAGTDVFAHFYASLSLHKVWEKRDTEKLSCLIPGRIFFFLFYLRKSP